MPYPVNELSQSASHLVRTVEPMVIEVSNRDWAAARALTIQARDALQHLEHALVLKRHTHAEVDHEAITLGTQEPTEGLPKEDGHGRVAKRSNGDPTADQEGGGFPLIPQFGKRPLAAK